MSQSRGKLLEKKWRSFKSREILLKIFWDFWKNLFEKCDLDFFQLFAPRSQHPSTRFVIFPSSWEGFKILFI